MTVQNHKAAFFVTYPSSLVSNNSKTTRKSLISCGVKFSRILVDTLTPWTSFSFTGWDVKSLIS